MTPPPITRFAPSPTGFLHIGGARTALFNWLYARHHSGKMLLRIEDTDRARSTDAAIASILDGLSWLGLDWDDEPVYQSARADRHREVAEQLLASDKAYRCYASPQELNDMRATARAEGRPPIYDGRWRDRGASESPSGVNPVIRIKSPQQDSTLLHDAVQGDVSFPNKDLDDFILLRSDGTPTYMLAVAVDDHDMGVTQIIRGDDHLTNGARQQHVYDAMNWVAPALAHIPLIHGSDGAKLSKRHGALGVDAYRAMGYVPQAMRNYLVRLGWSHADDEVMSLVQMIDWFELSGIGRSAARFDVAKLENLNGQYLRATDDETLLGLFIHALPHLPNGDRFAEKLAPQRKDQLQQALSGLKMRAKTLVELMNAASFLVAERPIVLDDKATALITEDARADLAVIAEALSKLQSWTENEIESVVRAVAEKRGKKLGQLAQPLRAAVTGRAASPGIFEVLLILGEDEGISRIRDQAGPTEGP